ncbi:MAG: type II toxin-antitoxin system ParD family antitoxin [Alphaproteobacteria bacterium]
MNISLNSQLEHFIEQKIKSGFYNSASEVVREGLRLLIEKEMLFQQQITKLNQDIDLGLQQLSLGEGIEGEKVFNEIKNLSKIKHLERNKNKK